VIGGSYDPVTMNPGVYTYTVTGAAPCTDASAQIIVNEEQAPDAGIDASISLCPGSAPVDLFGILNGTPQTGGAWTYPNGGAFSGVFDPAVAPAGPQTYTVPGSTCPNASATVLVNMLPGPNAGGDNSISACSTQAPFSLTAQLTGAPDANGSWSDAAGNPVASTFDPATMTGGIFTYSVAGTANCPDDQAQLIIAVSIAPLAGTSGSLTLCANSAPQSLFDGLSGTLDAGGTWSAPDGGPHGTVLDPAMHAAGLYTYTVAGNAPCPSASSTVAVIIHPVPQAGEDGALVLCTTGPAVNLFSALGGAAQPGGTWTGPGGVAASGSFNPSSGLPGTYTYTVSGTFPCVNDDAVVVVSVATAGNAGTGANLTFCPGDPAIDLMTALGGNPDATGQWTAPDGSAFSGFFDPATGLTGTYTYTVTPPAPCPQVSAAIGITVVAPAVADFTLASAGECAPLEVSFSHAYTGPGTCTWILGDGQTVEQCAPFTWIYDQPGSYDVTLIVDAGNGCGADTVTVTDAVTAYAQPVASFDMVPASITTLQPVGFFSNTSEGANRYAWLINEQLVGTQVDLRHAFPAQIGDAYGICLVAYASAACADTVCRTITLEDGMVLWVPNTFTPNDDEKNEGFAPVVLGIDERFYRFEVFDRWGLRVFASDTPGEAWNGRHPDGTDAPIDVYVWKVRVKDAFSGDRVERIGHVSLLR
jgi:gliding motility-associated-like protein